MILSFQWSKIGHMAISVEICLLLTILVIHSIVNKNVIKNYIYLLSGCPLSENSGIKKESERGLWMIYWYIRGVM